MQGWVTVIAAALSAAVVVIILIVCIWRFCYSRRLSRITTNTSKTKVQTFLTRVQSLQPGSAKKDRESFSGFHQGRASFNVVRNGVLPKTSFNWADQPWLVSEAVEYGWPRFAFGADASSPSTQSTLLGLCAAEDQGRETAAAAAAAISWEVCPESVDFMQKISFNPELLKIDMGTSPLGGSCVIKSALPLPGPPLENSSFPQEAYFEIIIVSCPNDEVDSVHSVKRSPGDGELTKLIPQTSNVSVQSDSLIHFTKINVSGRFQEVKLLNKEGEEQNETGMFSMGLSRGGSLAPELPGSYPGSIGFNSNGSVFLDGIKLVIEGEKTEWESKDKVIGCGFDPSQKKVFFTVDSEVVHVINCKSEEFSCPLYPTLAANVDITVLVNFGQCAFKYSPANEQRTPNPCFIAPPAKGSAAAVGYEDSRDLFSMGINDSQWLNRYLARTNTGDMSSDPRESHTTELFEIAFSGPLS